MDAPQPSKPKAESTDVFSLTDQDLAEKLKFIEEIGFGNWGSVWLCRPKPSNENDLVKNHEQKIAVKLVHRSKTATTAARVRSLWNEMKIVRTFKSESHPAIVPFHSFIITPSYALITMAYLPTLIPVEVDETRARNWFHFLLSGVEFLHKRGVVHNDIKPANILLSEKSIPVLVDFGFAEKYDLRSSTAFHSNLAYGTPEYLSPERARGLLHDTRKSDVWSLGITFFEIMTGRTPFEYSDGEQFTTKEELEQYWARTLRGKWVGAWNMSLDLERLLCRMITPNADLRCTATGAMADDYWHRRNGSDMHRRSASCNTCSSTAFDRDLANLIATPPTKVNRVPDTPPGLENSPVSKLRVVTSRQSPPHSKSQPRIVTATKSEPNLLVNPSPLIKIGPAHSRKRVVAAPASGLSPIQASPPATPRGKENANVKVPKSSHKSNRKPFGNANNKENIAQPQFLKPVDQTQAKRRSRVLGDSTARYAHGENAGKAEKVKEVTSKEKSNHVKDRVRDWERERQRLREIQRLEELETESEEQEEQASKIGDEDAQEPVQEERLAPPVAYQSPRIPSTPSSAALNALGEAARRASNPALNHLKHSIKKSIAQSFTDKTMQFYKPSTRGRSTPRTASSFDMLDDATRAGPSSEYISWEEETLVREANTFHPARHPLHNDKVNADSKAERMIIWMRNVEKVVEDARENFALSAPQSTALPPLPVSPIPQRSSNARSGRVPRDTPPVSQIFAEENMKSLNDSTITNSSYLDQSSNDVSRTSSQALSSSESPQRRRRATVSTLSPEAVCSLASRSEPYLTQGTHVAEKLQSHIATLSLLEAELNKPPKPEPLPRLSQVIDSSLFIQVPFSQRYSIDADQEETRLTVGSSTDDLDTSSIYYVEPYPQRQPNSQSISVISTPERQQVESMYDRFLMATTVVKRVGKGYQSGCLPSARNSTQPDVVQPRRKHVMPPPVSSADLLSRPTMVVDELGTDTPIVKDESNATVAMVRRAIKAIVPGKTASKRLSRVVA
ncbi:hypothetical protein F5887DRAFT_1235165 [Amanita rubescens]|nr:hypothetical protein F5887DRAFT_1235165 [Amanita rubescens]